jgi:hypothetical protein
MDDDDRIVMVKVQAAAFAIGFTTRVAKSART